MGGPDSSLCISCTEEDGEPVHIAIYTEWVSRKEVRNNRKKGRTEKRHREDTFKHACMVYRDLNLDLQCI